MAVSRRNLLWHSVLAAVAFAAGPLKAWSANKPKTPKNQGQNNVTSGSLTHLDRAAFTREVGSSFQVSPASGKGNSVWLRLLKVEDLPALVPVNTGMMSVQPKTGRPVPATSGFILSFLGTMSQPLPQDTYTFEHAGLGTFSLLLVPGPTGQQTYNAVINRVH
ncbi:MAG TPA: hypothetical protein VI636_25355 [Candidatus Angelobacter sp.]